MIAVGVFILVNIILVFIFGFNFFYNILKEDQTDIEQLINQMKNVTYKKHNNNSSHSNHH